MVWWCCMVFVGCKCLQSRGLRLGRCKIGWLESRGRWVEGSKRRQGHDNQRPIASLLVAPKVVGSGGSWIVGQRSVVLGMDEGNLGKESVDQGNFGRGIWGWGCTTNGKKVQATGSRVPPTGGNRNGSEQGVPTCKSNFQFSGIWVI